MDWPKAGQQTPLQLINGELIPETRYFVKEQFVVDGKEVKTHWVIERVPAKANKPETYKVHDCMIVFLRGFYFCDIVCISLLLIQFWLPKKGEKLEWYMGPNLNDELSQDFLLIKMYHVDSPVHELGVAWWGEGAWFHTEKIANLAIEPLRAFGGGGLTQKGLAILDEMWKRYGADHVCFPFVYIFVSNSPV